MKRSVFLAGFMAALALSAQAISITDITVLNEDNPSGSNVTVVATITGAGAGAMASMEVKSTNGLVCQFFPPSDIQGNQWGCSDWNPYFTGEFIVTVQAWDQMSAPATSVTNVTVVRTRHGIINSVKVAASTHYDANGTWTDINTALVSLHNIGWMADPFGAASVGCNLVNANPVITPDMTEEQQDVAFTDTSAYKPVGTPFRFEMLLHERPTSIMGFGDIKLFIWTPTDTNAPTGPGQLLLDVVSCSPWRNMYTNIINAHVGFAPLFVEDPEDAEELEGMLMCTTAHYLDVSPTGNESESRIGLRVNGHSNTTSYLKMFIPDNRLAQFGITNVDMATNALMGYVTHFDNTGDSKEDTTATRPVFTRVPGGTNIVYDYDGDGVGDVGYEARFNFIFHSPVAAEIGPTGETPDSGFSWVSGDFDGDRKADPAIYYAETGVWYIWQSANNYAIAVVNDFGGIGWTGMADDYDGDRKADPAIYHAATGTMKVQLSAQDYAVGESTGLGGDGYHIISGDFDGDRKADLAVNEEVSGTFFVKLSDHNYAPASITGFGAAGWSQVNGDFDGDGYADMAIYNGSVPKWHFALSSKGYLVYSDNIAFGDPDYTPVSGDFDGDRKSDPTLYNPDTGQFYFALSGSDYLIYWRGGIGNPNSVAVNGDFDGDGKADPAVVDLSTGLLSVQLSSAHYATETLLLSSPQ